MDAKTADRRRETIAALRENPDVPVLIVGGGIIGTGLFRDLALQGVDVLLVDKSDISAGASAGPSRMIHGGLRYLEYGERDLVRESVRERNILLQNAPHYVFPLPTTIPILSRTAGLGYLLKKCLGLDGKRPPHRGSWMIRLGLRIYEKFGDAFRSMPRYSTASRGEALRRRPALRKDIRGTITYYDGWISYPERLCLELLQDGEALHEGAAALNYLAVDSRDARTVILRDEVTGEKLPVRPGIVVNAAGAWIDGVNGLLGLDTHMISGTRGGHLVLDNDELLAALDGEMIFYETPDGRACVALPWLNKPLIGSTDIRVDDPDDVRCEEDEADYIFDAIRVVFPDIRFDRSQILSSFSGVRPLRSSSASRTGQMSRAHYCAVLEPEREDSFPVYCMVGGKWTPFRVFAEHVADMLLARLGRPRKAGTVDVPIGGGTGYPAAGERDRWIADLALKTGLGAGRVEQLLVRYGTVAEQVAGYLAAAPDKPLAHHEGYTRREIEYILERERVVHLDDLVLRRTAIALLGELTGDLLDELASIGAATLDWSDEDRAAEIVRTKEILRDKFDIDL